MHISQKMCPQILSGLMRALEMVPRSMPARAVFPPHLDRAPASSQVARERPKPKFPLSVNVQEPSDPLSVNMQGSSDTLQGGSARTRRRGGSSIRSQTWRASSRRAVL